MKKQILTIAVVLFFIVAFLIYRWITSLPPTAIRDSGPVTAQRGEDIFWRKGTCHICHRIGERGYAQRGPDLGDGKDGELLPLRAATRADTLNLQNPLDYIIQSVTQPGAFIVPGFKNEMPEPYKPPIGLSPSEMKSVIIYLATLNGDSVTREIDLPERIMAYYGQSRQKDFRITGGDLQAGRKLFFDADGAAACAVCHTARDSSGEKTGGSIGPDLSAIGSYRTPEHILQKIIEPDSNIVSGYESVFVKLKQGQIAIGLLLDEDAQSLLIRKSDGKERLLRRKDIDEIKVQAKSMMPGNYGDLLTKRQLHDLTAFLASQINSGNNPSFEE